MLVVGDSSVFINFARVGSFDVLRNFPKIHIPRMVYDEVYVDGNYKPGSLEMAQAVKDGWVVCCAYTDTSFYSKLPGLPFLHEGERQALTLAYEMKANWILLDDEKAVDLYVVYLKPYGIKRAGTFQICDELYKQRKIRFDSGGMKLKLLEAQMKDNQIG